jgi:translation initiation factor 3 subunit C
VDEAADVTEERTEEPAEGAEVRVAGSLLAFVERLDNEAWKAQQVGSVGAGCAQAAEGWGR